MFLEQFFFKLKKNRNYIEFSNRRNSKTEGAEELKPSEAGCFNLRNDTAKQLINNFVKNFCLGKFFIIGITRVLEGLSTGLQPHTIPRSKHRRPTFFFFFSEGYGK